MDGVRTEILGLWVDFSDGDLRQAEICLVGETIDGHLVMTSVDDPDGVHMILPNIDGPGLYEIMQMLRAHRRAA